MYIYIYIFIYIYINFFELPNLGTIFFTPRNKRFHVEREKCFQKKESQRNFSQITTDIRDKYIYLNSI